MRKVKVEKKWVIATLALFGVSLISAGVFASASITLNNGGIVNLGAGTATVDACDSAATVSTQQTYNASAQRYELTTITLAGVDTTACAGKILSMAFQANSQTYSTTWGITGTGQQTLVWGGAAGTGLTSYSALTPVNTAASGITTIAISAQ